MTTASLWQDELYSVDQYSSKGPLHVMTHYEVANNHMFFNLLNSVTPEKHRFEPAHARFWSFTFVFFILLAMLTSQTMAGQPLSGALQSFLLLANIENLDLLLQARGYGLLAFAALACTLLTWSYFEGRSLVALIGIPVMVWLGAWTVPTFAFFGGTLLLTLLAYTRDWRWFYSGACAALAIFLVYWPVRASLVEIATTYPAIWGKEFANWNAISDLLSVYLLFGMGSWLTFAAATLLIIAVSRPRIRSPQDKVSLCLGISVLVTFIICLKMETAAKRTVAYTVVPLGFIAVTLLEKLLRRASVRAFKFVVIPVVVVATLILALYLYESYRFIPIEAWRETARKIESRFPKGTEIVARFRPQWLKVYISPGYPFTRHFDPAKFTAGKEIVVDSSFRLAQETARQAGKSTFPLQNLPKGYLVMTVPQRRGGTQKIYFSPSALNSPAVSGSGPAASPQDR